ncbi:hypothetical protein J31TS4_03810 [Paenibacillus sp. J31TS4]|uniref:hypothetical protein n=1 Tax=Paenibacillus sp. J31TS4 TaxID=2807195 RepID=UPI001B1FFB58|nr:hypothetical protein [Paenibacillus sp. J31TS4]GIP37101.1 hypothetical protein J31TS4_03810 [Paenibacillus sp. J31TS4]
MNGSKRALLAAAIFCVTLTGCSKNTAVQTVITSIASIDTERLNVNCSEEVNRHKRGPINAIGYLCAVKITDDTSITTGENKPISRDELKVGDSIRIELMAPMEINETNRTLEAKEIVRLYR